jgi:hypothetical protein
MDLPTPGTAVFLARGRDLDQIAACVVEHGGRRRARLERLLGKSDTETAKSLELLLDVGDGEGRKGDAVLDELLA